MHGMFTRIGRIAAIIGFASALAACQSGYRSHARNVDTAFSDGEYRTAASIAEAGANQRANDRSERVIYNLEAARTAQVAGDPATSRKYYDAVYEDISPYLNTKAEATVTEAVVTTAVNQAMATYKATPGERVMASSLNAVNCLAMGDRDAARVELNRANNWQQDSNNRYAKQMREAQDEALKEGMKQGLDDAMNDGVPDYLEDNYRNLQTLRGYANYQNPFTNHLRAVYYLACGVDATDLGIARNNFLQAFKLNPAAGSAIKPDLRFLDSASSAPLPPTTWIYFMTGRAPRLEEFRLDIPIPAGNVNYVSAAFPELKTNDDNVESFHVRANGTRHNAVSLSNIDAIVASEFEVRLPTIISQEILSSAGKAAATWALSESAGTYGQIAGIIYQAASTSADLRTWRTLPKEILLCRIPTPEDGVIEIGAEGGRNLGRARVTPGESNIVVITLPSAKALEPAITTAQLTENQPISYLARPADREPTMASTPTEAPTEVVRSRPTSTSTDPTTSPGAPRTPKTTPKTTAKTTAVKPVPVATTIPDNTPPARAASNPKPAVATAPSSGWMTRLDPAQAGEIAESSGFNLGLSLHAEQHGDGETPNGIGSLGEASVYRIVIPAGAIRTWKSTGESHKVLLWGEKNARHPRVYARKDGITTDARVAGNRGNGPTGQISYIVAPGTDLMLWDKSDRGWKGWAVITPIEDEQP